ncbi:hypothetical protein ElyMa_000117500 [Elysia marginata]|uniref:Tudor domain-containing protein n=1 Tax=Elysia marginata TaxID=1093978 RepID=A0AAV4EN48_9GAST|nr:hypothetical protein ElyMa_000117500 [Elysia marginata]
MAAQKMSTPVPNEVLDEVWLMMHMAAEMGCSKSSKTGDLPARTVSDSGKPSSRYGAKKFIFEAEVEPEYLHDVVETDSPGHEGEKEKVIIAAAEKLMQIGDALQDSKEKSEIDQLCTDLANHINEVMAPNIQERLVLLDDNQMECLRATLLATGKGRRPSLPPLVVNNKLLYQLHLLREEAKAPAAQVQIWFQKLFPGSAFPADRFCRHMDRVAENFSSLKPGEEPAFLLTRVDFDFLSAALDVHNVTRLLDKTSFKACTLTNELVLDLQHHFKKEMLQYNYFHEILSALSSSPLSLSPLDLWKKATKLEVERRKLIKNKRQNPEKLAVFLRTPFMTALQNAYDCHPPSCSNSSAAEPPTSARPNSTDSRPPRPDVVRVYMQKAEDAQQRSQKLEEQMNVLINLSKTKSSEISELQSTCAVLQSQVTSLTKKTHEMEEQLKDVRTSRLYKCKWRLQQKAKRLDVVLGDNEKLKEKVLGLEQQKVTVQKKVHLLKKARDKCKKDKDVIDSEFLRELKKENDFVPALKLGNRFTDEVRRTVVALLSQCNVSATQCSKVIQTVALELFNVKWGLNELPSPQTLLTIADEAYVLAKLATVDQLKASNNFTLHLDGTSRHQRKYVGHQITLDNGKVLSLGFVDVPCEDAATLLDVTVAVLTELGDIYDPENRDKVFQEILGKMHSTMTDRASAMKKFASSLESIKKEKLGEESELHFLHCNAHFLLGLSSSSESALKEVEKEIGRKLGRDLCVKFKKFSSAGESSVARYIRTACAILGPRGNQKSGCRVEWLAFCQEQDVPVCSRLPSYKSNRFNCYFEAAARLIQLHETILSFLNGSYLSHSNLLIDSVREDNKDCLLMALVAVVAFFFLHFTCPYWQLMQSKTPFSKLHSFVQELQRDLVAIQEEPSLILNETYCSSLWTHYPSHPGLKASLTAFISSLQCDTHGPMKSATTAIAQACQDVLKRQLVDFLAGGKFDFTCTESPIYLNCPITNVVGENAFGDFDFLTQKHRRASLFHVSSLQTAKQNRVSQWLQTTEDPKAAMAHARKTAAHFRESHRKREKEVMLAVRRKMLKNAADEEQRLANLAETKRKIIQAVLDHGGPCTTAADVAALTKRLQKGQLTEALKQEIRYQKVVLGVPGLLKLTKPVAELTQQLQDHFSGISSNGHTVTPTVAESQDAESENDENDAPDLDSPASFKFERPSQWVTVYYDNTFYVGQVISVLQSTQAEVKFLEQTKVRKDYFCWPRADDIALVDAEFIFAWDFDVLPVSSDCRIWQVANVDDLTAAYERIRIGYL